MSNYANASGNVVQILLIISFSMMGLAFVCGCLACCCMTVLAAKMGADIVEEAAAEEKPKE
jgi:hypothetical protein